MPPKTKRLPHPIQHHLKNSRQLLEDFLYQYLPQISCLGALSRLNLYSWFGGRWGLSADASAGVPYMVLEALRLQRQFLLSQKLALKPLSLALLGNPEEALQPRALPFLEETSNQNHTARITGLLMPEQEMLKQLHQLLQRQPASERNLLLLDPLDLALPPLQELLLQLPKRMDVLLILPTASIRKAGGLVEKQSSHASFAALADRLPTLQPTTEDALPEEVTSAFLLKKLGEKLSESSNRLIMRYSSAEENPVALLGITSDTLMMEKMLLSKYKLEQLALEQKQAGHQLGLFRGGSRAQASPPEDLQKAILRLLSQQQEWNNQEFYYALLKHELLPQQALMVLQALAEGGKLEVLDEKKKKLKTFASLPVTQTAYKLPAPSRYFRLLP